MACIEVVVDKTASVRSFKTFAAAEKWARRQVLEGNWDGFGSIYIDIDDRTVAAINLDAAGRVWTDLKDTDPALVKEIGL
jgi:hypothetical protein